jgi:hypothetical protein
MTVANTTHSSGRDTIRAPLKSELIISSGHTLFLAKSSNISAKGILFQLPGVAEPPSGGKLAAMIKLPLLNLFSTPNNDSSQTSISNFEHQILRIKIGVVRAVPSMATTTDGVMLAGKLLTPSPTLITTLTSLVEIIKNNMEYLLKLFEKLQQDRDTTEKIFFYASQLGYSNLSIKELWHEILHDYQSIKKA